MDRKRRRHLKFLIGLGFFGTLSFHSLPISARSNKLLIDDFSDTGLKSTLGTVWRGVSDQVMGGISAANVAKTVIDGGSALRLSGDVKLENNGGFIQAALDLEPDGGQIDASGYTGIRMTVRGNGETYNVHLRTTDNERPWQSYRAAFTAGADWTTITLPFAGFTPHRLTTPLDIKALKRIGLVAIGRAFYADLAVTDLRFYR